MSTLQSMLIVCDCLDLIVTSDTCHAWGCTVVHMKRAIKNALFIHSFIMHIS